MKKDSRNTSPESRQRSQDLRNDISLSERLLWHHLRNDKLGYRFRRQVRVGPYFLDFYCAKSALCVEVDGEQHADRKPQDDRRDAYLRERNIETLRIPSLDLHDEHARKLGQWLVRIEQLCNEREAARLSPSPLSSQSSWARPVETQPGRSGT